MVKIGRLCAKIRPFENGEYCLKMIKILRITMIQEQLLIFGNFLEISNARNFAQNRLILTIFLN